MGINFELAAEFGDNREGALTFAKFFSGAKWQLSTEPFFETVVESGIGQGQSGSWWAFAIPSGLGSSGAGTPELARRMTEAGFRIFEKLKFAPPFRYAMVAIQCFDWRDVEELPEVMSSLNLNGFVLSENLWIQFGRPHLFIPFSPGYWWRPFQGIPAPL